MLGEPNNMTNLDLSISSFIKDGFQLKKHLLDFLHINNDQLDQRLINGQTLDFIISPCKSSVFVVVPN